MKYRWNFSLMRHRIEVLSEIRTMSETTAVSLAQNEFSVDSYKEKFCSCDVTAIERLEHILKTDRVLK